MTLSDITTLVNKLVRNLQSGGASVSDRDLAEEYAEACLRINERLSQCARMIDEGSAVQALMLAEEKPNLLDAVAALSFAQSAEWYESCALSALRQAPKIDRNAVHKVNDLYNKGNKTEQTKALYKQFRAAMAARDDTSALDTIRTIASLDSADLDAAKELTRLERKRREDLLKAISMALASGDDGETISLLEQGRKLGMPDSRDLEGAIAVERRVLTQKAREEIAGIIPTLSELEQLGRWQQCGERATRVKALCSAYHIELPGADSALVAVAMAHFDSCRQEALHRARFKESAAALSDCADRIQSGEKSSSKKTLDDVEEQRLQLKKAYEKAKEFLLPIPDALVTRVGQVASDLDSEILRLRTRRKVRNISLATCSALLLLALVVGGYFVLRAGQLASELRNFVSEGKSIPLRKLSEQIEEQHSAYLAVPTLKSALLEANAWLEGVTAKTTAAESSLVRARSLAEEEFANSTPEEAAAIFDQANKAVDQLPGDLGETMRPQLAEAENKLSIWLASMRDGRVVAAKAKIQQSRELAAKVDASVTGDELREALTPFASSVEELIESTESQVEQMRLPAGVKADISDLVAKLEQAMALLESHNAAMASLAVAASAEEYAAAIKSLAEVQMPRSPLVKAAQNLATKKLDEHQFLGAMVLPSAPEVWTAIKGAQDLGSAPQPQATRESEVDRLRELLNSENIAGVHEATLQDRDGAPSASSGRKIFIRGKMNITQPGDGVTRASGTIYDPALSGGKLNFEPRTFNYTYTAATSMQSGQRIDKQTESDASQAMQKFGLETLVNADGSKYQQNILAMMDKVAAARSAPPLVKAYVLQELAAILRLRPNEWGLVWVPALDEHLQEMKRLAGGSLESGDWMVPIKTSKIQELTDWFRRREGFSFMAQQAINRQLTKTALESGLIVCGYIGSDGALVETNAEAIAGATELWALSSQGSVPFIAFSRDNDSPESPLKSAGNALPLSPVFCLPLDRAAAVATALRAANVPEDVSALYLRDLPPLFAVRPARSSDSPNEQ